MKEIIINKEENRTILTLVENGILIEKYEENDEQIRLEGNIYIGKVQNVLPGMQAAFVNIGQKKNTFIHLKDALPKLDVKTNDIDKIVDKNNIKEVIKPGMNLLVQVKRDATNKKGARVSTHISIPSRFCVFMPNADFITISQKIENEEERNRLINIVKKQLPKGCGAIVRTSAMEKSEEYIIKDINEVIEKWKEILQKQKESTNDVPILVYNNPNMIERLLIDVIDQDIHRVIVNDEKVYSQVKGIIERLEIKRVKIVLEERNDILDIYGINKQLEYTNNRKIWLKCGGFITIDKTEALTAIDVNSGKYIGSKSLEQTVFTVNKEASIEIAKQLRLRDIGGIIIIDYIDMKEEENKEKIINILEEKLKNDRSKTQVVGFSKLNLLEMTRKHMCSNE